jgi:hypothetical protein
VIATLYSWTTIAVVGSWRQEPVDVAPSRNAPGNTAIGTMVDWLAQYALWACLASVLAGGGMYAWGRANGHNGRAVSGGALAAGGAVGAVLVGLAPDIVNQLFRTAGQ